jgi:hypothetical protein
MISWLGTQLHVINIFLHLLHIILRRLQIHRHVQRIKTARLLHRGVIFGRTSLFHLVKRGREYLLLTNIFFLNLSEHLRMHLRLHLLIALYVPLQLVFLLFK